ncbi:peptidoglycan recognition protein family protein [Streptomyces sp. NPDC001781]
MATPMTADRLLAVLKAEGLRVVEYKDWRHHDRAGHGGWGPINGVIMHHTVTKGTASTVAQCYNGYPDLPGPLCHGVIAKDGTVYLVSAGRANHAGKGDDDVLTAVVAEKATPSPNENNADGNVHFYGFECENLGDGKDPWPSVQRDAMVRAGAAICREYGWSAPSVIGHKEWTNTKVDPRVSPGGADVAMPTIRTLIAERLKHAASWSPSAPTTPKPPTQPRTTEQRLTDLEKRVTALEKKGA